ncbi:MAG: hypothetical protein JST01_04290 [Cyanobacteria bacterium SZAS TMP-1]|nr:hypothetical protein [Cyanobacteria bacterium SZAS TMP-1]
MKSRPPPTSPRLLYRRIWRTVPYFFYEASRLDGWKQWQYCFDSQIESVPDALGYARQMLASLNDEFTALYSPEEWREIESDDALAGDINRAAAVSFKLMGNTGYIRLDNFFQSDIVEQMQVALAHLAAARDLVLDLRNNPGGKVESGVDIAALFLDEGRVLRVRRRIPMRGYESVSYELNKEGLLTSTTSEESGAVENVLSARRLNISGDKKLIVFVDENTMSTAEILAAALRDNRRAIILGARTFGKGIGQLVLPLPHDCVLSITVQHHFTPSGLWIGDGGSERHGIEPDLYVCAPPACETLGPHDQQFQVGQANLPPAVAFCGGSCENQRGA